jgi:small subunit ribosomal protein S6
MGKYELLYIVHPDLESSIDKITGQVRAFIESRKGKITYEENWGKRKLAYPIKKSDVGIYVLWYFEAPKDTLAKIERDIRLTEEIIRYLLIAKEDKLKKVAAKPEIKETVKATEEKEEKPEVEKPVSKKKVVKKAPKKEPEEPAESEEDRMKMLDEKLGEILGKESDNKDSKAKEEK